jgi:hypothetical protein
MMLPNYQSKVFKLYYRNELMGVITNPSTDQPWFMGDFAATDGFAQFRAGFDAMAEEDWDRSEEPLVDLEHWEIEDDGGVRDEALVQITGTDIHWRW